MASETLADLLGVSSDTPNAYQVLGLQTGESDAQRIADAVAAAVRRLKQRREETNAEAWNEAAAAVKHARKILSDPAAKAAYDDQLRKMSELQPSTGPSAPASVARQSAGYDPLAGLLPTSDPFAPFDPQRAAAESAGPSTFARPTAAVRTEASGATQDHHRRRNSLPRTPLVLAALGLATLSVIAASVYVLTKQDSVAVGPGASAVAPTQGTAGVDAAPEAEQAAAPTAANGQAVDAGPFAGGLGPALAADAAGRADDAAAMDDEPSSIETAPPQTAPVATPATAAATPTEPEQDRSMAEKRQTGEQAYQQARLALATQNWAQIKSLAEQATDAAADEEQTLRAARLYQLAVLADYYHGGIVRALEGLNAGATLELSDDPEVPLTVAVVEADASMLQIRFNGRNKSYAFDQIPLVLVHKLARFTMDLDAPTGMAAKAAFQSVCALATPAHRQQAIQWLSQIDGDIQGANAEDLRAAIEQLDEP